MDFAGILILGGLVLTGVYLAVRMPLAIFGNKKLGARFRENLGRRLADLRLNSMLKRRGIDKREYLHQTPVMDIHQQMHRCAGCQSLSRCDENLADEQAPAEAFGEFCPNDGELSRVAERQSIKREAEQGN